MSYKFKGSKCSGCQHCEFDCSKCLKNFLNDLKKPEFILTNDRVIWEYLYTEIHRLFKMNENWIEEVDFFSFLEFSFETDYLFKLKSNISVLGLKLLASLCDNEEYFCSIKSQKAFSIFSKNMNHILKSIYLQTSAFYLISILSKHISGKMWILEEKIFENLISPCLFSTNEFIQRDAVICLSSIWCSKDNTCNASDWIIGHLQQLLEENNVKMGDNPKEGYDVLSVVKLFTRIIEENYKQYVSSEKLLYLLQSLNFNPYNHMESKGDSSICHKFCFINILDEYAKISRDMDEGKKINGHVDENEDILLKTIAYGVFHLGIHRNIIEQSIDMYPELELIAFGTPEQLMFENRFHNIFCTLITFQITPLCAILTKLLGIIDQEPEKFCPCKDKRKDATIRRNNIQSLLTASNPDNPEFLSNLKKSFCSYLHDEFTTECFQWSITVLKLFAKRCNSFPDFISDLLEALLVELLISILITWNLFNYPDALIENIFHLLTLLFRNYTSEFFYNHEDVYEQCIVDTIEILKLRRDKPKVICKGLDLILVLFNNRELLTSETTEDILFFTGHLGSVLQVYPSGEREEIPGTSDRKVIKFKDSNRLCLLDHPSPEVKLSCLNIIRAVIVSKKSISEIMEWIYDFKLLMNIFHLLSDTNQEVVAVAVDVICELFKYDRVWELFLPKNICGFCMALVSESTAIVRVAGVNLVDRLVSRRHFWCIDLELYLLPIIRLAAEDEDDTVRCRSLSFMAEHVVALFGHARLSLKRIRYPSVPTPHLAVLIWITQYGYGGSLMKLCYDKSAEVTTLAKAVIEVILLELKGNELADLAKQDFKLYDVPVEEFVETFKAYEYSQEMKDPVYFKRVYGAPIYDELMPMLIDWVSSVTDLTDLLPPELAKIQKYKKVFLEAIPRPERKDYIQPVTVKDFLSFLGDIEKASCSHPKNNEKYLMSNIEAYIGQLTAPRSLHGSSDPCSADCY